jgi:hypothetical protein
MYLLEAPKYDPIEAEKAKFEVFGEACRILEEAGIPHVMGGGVAVRAYGRERPLKDADIFMRKEEVFKAMDALTVGGAFHTRDTDATWLYKAIKADVLVDIIVRTTGNIFCTEQTFKRARRVELHGHSFLMMGPEDLLFRKILSHREGRPDLFDAFSMLEQPIADFDWPYFLRASAQLDVRRILGFMLWAQSELQNDVIPKWVICSLNESVMRDYCEAEAS